MNDKELIDRVARVWVSGGGDAEGMAYCWLDIAERVAEIKKQEEEARRNDPVGMLWLWARNP